MENTPEEIQKLEQEFKASRKLLNALGDETRQHLICIMLEGECSGARVVEIAKKTNLSRPAVSHHMQILKEANIVKQRKEGTCIYYYLDPDKEEILRMIKLFQDIQTIMSKVPDRSEKELE